MLGTHGARPEEQERAQPFEVDLDLELDLGPAGRSDALADTADYGRVVATVSAVVSGRRYALLEALAEAIAGELLGTGSPAGRPVAGAALAGG
ncbi:MAG: dihydroneopterin aldolase, partial [Acidimicrobiales bacterium]